LEPETKPGDTFFYNRAMNFNRIQHRSIALVLFITTVIAYGLLLTRTGFYWDDWPFAWIAEFRGPGEFLPAFEGVRPFLGPIFLLTTSLIPPVPLYWQILALAIRFLSALSAWFLFKQLWPDHQGRALVASLLFLVFPAYSQHWVALTHINQEWVSLICYVLSFGFTAYALRQPASFLRSTLIALLLLFAGVFPTEYFVALEILRLFLIWMIVQEQTSNLHEQSVRSLKLWLPYFAVWMANAAWLAYFYTIGNYASYEVDIVQEPLSLYQVFWAIFEAVWKVGLYAWGQVILHAGNSLGSPSSLLTLALIGAAFLFFAFYLSRFAEGQITTRRYALSMIFIGLIGILAGRLPSFAAGLPLTLQSSMDRFTISMMLGGTLFILGLVHLLVSNTRLRTFAFALLIALAVGQQFFNANIFRRDWEKQQQIYWQMAWRMPAIQPGTAILTDELAIDYETDLSLTAPINWMYAPDYTGGDLPYGTIFATTRLGGPVLPSFDADQTISIGMRAATFNGSTSQVIVIHMPEAGCLRVLDPALGDQVTYDKESKFLVDAIPLSKSDLIDAYSTQTPQIPFVPEPQHTWCYYFTKAELARQQGDWQKAVDLYEEAISLGYEPGDAFEWLVFIEAQAMTGNVTVAQQLSEAAIAEEVRVRAGVCQVWKRVQVAGPARSDLQSAAGSILLDLECAP
jgi:hypothetical protein